MLLASLLSSLEGWFDDRVGQIHTVIPGIVQSYDGHEKRTATVIPAVNFKVPRGPTIKQGPISGVPVIFPSSAGFQMLFPIKEGDGVLLLFSEASIGNWLAGSGQVDPESSTRFSMHDAIAIPGLWQVSHVPKVTMPKDGDFVLLAESGVHIGGTTEGKLDLANDKTDLRTEVEKLWDAVAATRQDLATGFTSLAAVCTSPAALVPVGGVTPLATSLTTEAATHTGASGQITTDKTALKDLLA